ncbi:MAG: glycosyltransferase [Lautropia sp.]|nr:glycosyltransferase [Lautropia sp.]
MISIIIPVLNEATLLAAALEDLRREAGSFEVIVVDGGSSDRTVACVPEHPRVRLVHAAQGRAVQMNAGAAVAAGDLLLFLHVDTRPPPGSLEAIAGGKRPA